MCLEKGAIYVYFFSMCLKKKKVVFLNVNGVECS